MGLSVLQVGSTKNAEKSSEYRKLGGHELKFFDKF